MFRIRRIYDDVLPADRDAVRQVQEILSTTIEGVHPDEVGQLPERLRKPFPRRFLNLLFAAEKPPGRVQGFALLLHEPELRFSYLDYIASAPGTSGRGVGGALYQRVRDEARDLRARGLFFESLPDDPAVCRRPDGLKLKENADRLRFYESFGARPIAGTAYETPVGPGDDCPPFLLFDDLGTGEPLSGADPPDPPDPHGGQRPPRHPPRAGARLRRSAGAGQLDPPPARRQRPDAADRAAGLPRVAHPRRARSGSGGLPAPGLRRGAGRQVGLPLRLSDPQPGAPAARSPPAGRLLVHRHFYAHPPQRLPGGAPGGRLHADRGGRGPGRAALRLRPGPPARPPRRAPRLRRLLLFQQRGGGGAIPGRPRPHRRPRRGLPPRQRPAGHILGEERRADRVHPRPSHPSPIHTSAASRTSGARGRGRASI